MHGLEATGGNLWHDRKCAVPETYTRCQDSMRLSMHDIPRSARLVIAPKFACLRWAVARATVGVDLRRIEQGRPQRRGQIQPSLPNHASQRRPL